MTHGVYSAGAAMARLEIFQEVTANNLANAATTGFRRDLMTAREPLRGESGMAVGPLKLGRVETAIMLESGGVEPTGSRTDLAITGDGFFVVENGGKSYLTRAGAFARNENGEMMTASGDRLMGDGGPIVIESDDFAVSQTGEVSAAGSVVGMVRIAGVAPGVALRKAGGSRIEMPSSGVGPRPDATSILQGYLEGSNVNAIREMVSLVEAFRVYEANAKSVTTADEILDKAVNQVGRARVA
jgi:flagellar basal-body rod protein FlgG